MLARILVSLLLLVASGLGAANRWTLTTDDTRLTLSVRDDQPVIEHLTAARSKVDWIGHPLPVGLMNKVWLSGREQLLQWSFVRALQDRPAGTLSLVFSNAWPALELHSVWRARPGRGPVEHWWEFFNQSGQRVTVPQLESLALPALYPGGPARVWWIKRGGSNASTEGGTFVESLGPDLKLNLVSNCEDGASPVPWLAVQVDREQGLYAGWEFSGLGRIALSGLTAGNGLQLLVGNLPEFKTDVEPGERFLVPPAFVGCYLGDLEDGSYSLHRWVVEKLRPPMPPGVADPTLAYNLYLDAGGASAKEADVLRSAEFCRDLGFETFMPDAMWFPETGDWRWDPARFPQGIAPIASFVHRNRMYMALWCAWSNGGISEAPGALSVRGPSGHPDWFNGDFAADWKPGPFYGGQICLGCEEAKEWAVRKTQWLVSEHHLDYLKHDIGPIVTHCNKTSHRHHYGVDASYWAAMGYYEVQEKLRRAHPALILENCSGGGHIKDYGAMARTHYVVTTDTLSNLPDRQSIYDSTFALPPLVLQAYTYEWEYKVPGDDPGPFLWRSAMMGAWQIDPTATRRWTEEDRSSARRAAQLYKEWVRPMLPDVKVHHILPRPDGTNWDGMFYWSHALRRGTLYIFRPAGPEKHRSVKLQGLEDRKRYRVWCEDGSVGAGTRTGRELMRDGVAIRLPEPYTSDLVFVQDTALPAPKALSAPGEFKLGSATATSDPFTVSANLSWQASQGAHRYQVTVADSSGFEKPLIDRGVVGTNLALTDLPAGKNLFWKVEAVSWGGRRPNARGPDSFLTPNLVDLSGVEFVTDLRWRLATAGAGNTVHRGTNYFGQPIRIGGRIFPKSLWTHAFEDATPADIRLDITGLGVNRFVADVGVESSAGAGTVEFQVLADNVVRARSPVLKQGEVYHLQADLGEATLVILRVLNGGDGYVCDHAAWGSPRFIKTGSVDPLAR